MPRKVMKVVKVVKSQPHRFDGLLLTAGRGGREGRENLSPFFFSDFVGLFRY